METIRSELFELPLPETRDAATITHEALSAGETLVNMADYWHEATPEERRDMVWSLLNKESLLYDLERHVIVGLKPRAAFLPVLALGLEATEMWEQRGDSLWLREEYWPPKLDRDSPRLPSQPPALTPAQQERAIALIRQGLSLRKIAELLGTSHEAVRRFSKSQGITFQPSVQKLTPEQLEEAYEFAEGRCTF